ncbi:MAG: type II secretion system F family protein [Smithellaceae bacterium]
MANYIYQAIDENGKTVAGVLEAESSDMANSLLAARGLMPSQIIEEKISTGKSIFSKKSFFGGKVKVQDLILFTKQFRSMLHAGVPILRLLQVLESQTESKVLRSAITKIIQDIRQGSSLADALGNFPKIFSPLYCSMIRAGEISGSVPNVLERLIYIIEHETKVKSDIKAALRYPQIVVIALSIAFIVLLTFVVPVFANMFSKAGLTLPWPTQLAMFLYSILKNYWYLIIAAAIIIIFGLRTYFKTIKGSLMRDSILLEIPIIGPLFKKAAMSRFASIFAILQTSGVPIMQSLSILSESIGNAAISQAFDHIRERIQEGKGISAPLKTAKYFTPMVIDMIAIGEESGNIDEMLREITKHYDDEVAYAVQGLTDAIGPILIVGLAAVVGFFCISHIYADVGFNKNGKVTQY